MAGRKLIFSVRDSKDENAQVIVYLPETITLVQGQTAATELAPLIDDMIGGFIKSISLTVPLTLPGGIKTAPNANTDVEEGARFIFTSNPPFKTAVRIPTFLESLIASDSRQVEVGIAAVADFIDYMENGNGTDPEPSDYRGEDITVLYDALESFHASRRG